MKNNMRFPSAIILLLLLLASCSNELTRGKAAKTIKEFYEYPNVEVGNIYNRLDWSISGTYKPIYNKLQDLGLITMHEYTQWGTNYSINLTDKGKAYSLATSGDRYMVISNIREFKEITGITKIDENNAKVEFSVVRKKVTPFGEINGFKEDDLENYSVEMKKYDDGWRITNRKEKNLLPKDFPNVFK